MNRPCPSSSALPLQLSIMSVDVLANVLSNIDLSSTDQDPNVLQEAIEVALTETAADSAQAPEPIQYVSGKKRKRSEFIPPLINDLSITELRLLKRGAFEDLLGELTYRQLLEFHKTRSGKGLRLRVWQYRLLSSCLEEA